MTTQFLTETVTTPVNYNCDVLVCGGGTASSIFTMPIPKRESIRSFAALRRRLLKNCKRAENQPAIWSKSAAATTTP